MEDKIMKESLSKLTSVQILLEPDTVTGNEGVLHGLLEEIKDAHVQLGACLAYDCCERNTPEVVKNAMRVLGILYGQLNEIYKERDAYLQSHPDEV